MREAAIALAKVRTNTYIIFFLQLLTLGRGLLEDVFGISNTKALYGLVAILTIEALICTLHIVKFVSEIPPKEKNIKPMTMYAARIRYILLLDMILMIVLVIVHSQFGIAPVVTGIILLTILLDYWILKYLTILQRNRY